MENRIIIDDVNVQNCDFYKEKHRKGLVKINHYCAYWGNSCASINNCNCEYKRAKRLAQRNKDLQDSNDVLKEHNRYYKNENKKYKKIIGKLKQENKILQKEYLTLNVAHNDLKLILFKNWIRESKKGQALKEIESLCKDETCDPCKELEENDNCDECHCKIILDIIEEARGTNANKTRK